MAAQSAMITEAIMNLKAALARKRDDAGIDDPITKPTNRGNKMHANAEFVHEGALGTMNGRQFYRKKAEHAGYMRDILERNPPRYDFEGDEIDWLDGDEYSDTEVGDENPFAEVIVQDILAPLKHPSELATHPSMAPVYKSKALNQMLAAADARVRQERLTLWKAKKLHKEFLGDAPWIPCGFLETMEDRNLFEPRWAAGAKAALSNGYSRQSSSVTPSRNGSMRHDRPQPPESISAPAQEELSAQSVNGVPAGQDANGQDTEMPDAEEQPRDEAQTNTDGPFKPNGYALPPAENANERDTSKLTVNNDDQEMAVDKAPSEAADKPKENTDNNGIKDEESSKDENASKKGSVEPEDEDEDNMSPEPPRRMTTRAQANHAANPRSADMSSSTTRAVSPSDTDPSLLQPDPLYLLPPFPFDRTCGLPPYEAEETRRLLWSYIQKQEETVRAFTEMHNNLLKAQRMKKDVLEWCKAEGHIGEMSDGEDWYDREEWGLAEGEDLKKGSYEDEVEVDEGRATGKRGRGRRA